MAISKKIIILLVVLGLVGAGVFAYMKFRSFKQVVNNSGAQSSNVSTDEMRQQEFENAIKKTSASDQDLDGISDADEAKYKTSTTSSDTDEDGLNDPQEIFNFKTDPLKPDTDGDGFSDGYEVRRGTSPNNKN